jgi:hypothetical protein
VQPQHREEKFVSKKHVRRNAAVNAFIAGLVKAPVKKDKASEGMLSAEKLADFTHKSSPFRKDGATPKMSGDWLVADRVDGEWADLVAKPEFKALKTEYKSASIKYGRVMVHVKDLAA